jgi:nucleotide-binding universal stress UspA family protein
MKYLVPYDFSPITRIALDHAFALSKYERSEIQVLHIIKNDSERAKAEKRFKELMDSLDAEQAAQLITNIRVGDIYQDISKEAQDGGYQLLIMGTHGAKGLQKVLGSHAIKVITSSNTPFIITQKKGPSEGIKRIVLPVDLSYEKIQMVGFASSIAQKFDAEVHVIAKAQTDDFLIKRLSNNFTKVKRQLQKDGVRHVVSSLNGKHSFHKEVIAYGAEVKADLFAIAHFPESIIPQFETFSQELITNEWQTPVLIVNIEERMGVNANYSFVGI